MAIRARRPELPLSAGIPRHWLAGSAVATHLANGINLLFPSGERFFIRSVRHYLDRIEDAAEREDVRGFFGQEGRHAAEHERFFELLEAQGYEIRRFVRWYERRSAEIEARLSPQLRLATTAAAEHFTATLAYAALAEGLIDSAHPEVKALLFWHAAEEIEHKAVAFDVLQKVAPGYGVRALGLAVATLTLTGFWFVAAKHLLRQEGLSLFAVARELRRLGAEQPLGRRVFLRGIREYLAPGFHPWQRDDRRLAERGLETAGLAV
jgi:uncharacterized protein